MTDGATSGVVGMMKDQMHDGSSLRWKQPGERHTPVEAMVCTIQTGDVPLTLHASAAPRPRPGDRRPQQPETAHSETRPEH